MRYKKMTPHELAQMTVNDIERRRRNKEEGKRQADNHYFNNMYRVKQKLAHSKR